MGVFHIVILIGVICGPIMIIGSMFLLYKGSISLQAVANEKDALSIEFMKEIKLSTRYPAIALFLIGFLFFVTSANYAQEGNVKSIKIIGTLSSPDPVEDIEMQMSAKLWKQNISHQTSGTFSAIFRPTLENLHVVILAPGYENDHDSRNLDHSSDEIFEFGMVNLGRRLITEVKVQEEIPQRATQNDYEILQMRQKFNETTNLGSY